MLVRKYAGVAKLVDAPALGAGPSQDGGSSPLPGTNEDMEFVPTRKPERAKASEAGSRNAPVGTYA